MLILVKESAAGDNHFTLDNPVGINNSISDRSADGVSHLEFHIAVECSSLVLGILRKSIVHLPGQVVGPQSARNTKSDGLANGAKHGVESQDNSNLLVSDLGHDGKRSTHGPDTTANTMENLTHDKVPNIVSRLSEVNEESSAEHTPGDAKNSGPVVSPVPTKEAKCRSDERGENGRSDREGVERVSGSSNTETVNDLEESTEKASTKNGSILEELERNIGNLGIPLLPGSEANKADNTDNKHGDYVVGLPAIGRSCCNVEWCQDQREASNSQDHTDNIKLDEIVFDGLPSTALALLR
ncbi:hypothetical protein HG531_010385 [Fusarium graminearum]|nr:hypothetical protein HG531_010385 [Fusarium graminearum]